MEPNKSWNQDNGLISGLSLVGTVGTGVLNDELKAVNNFETYLNKNRGNMIPHNLPIHLDMLLEKKGLKRAAVARDSHLDRKYVYKVFDGTITPSRDKLIAIAFGLHLSDEETQTMLKLSENRELYAKDVRDAIILFSLQRNMNIDETNDLLFDHGFKLLGNLDN